ncbi:NADPH-dependent oxidoreductase 2-alkenal reductase, partial [Mucuna pruriens]
MLNIVYKRITIRGFLVSDYVNVFAQFLAKTLDYLRAGKLKVIEDISLGVESIPSAFVELFNGANIGKKIVKIAQDLTLHAQTKRRNPRLLSYLHDRFPSELVECPSCNSVYFSYAITNQISQTCNDNAVDNGGNTTLVDVLSQLEDLIIEWKKARKVRFEGGKTMGDSSEEMESYSPKIKVMIKQMKRIVAKLCKRLEMMEKENRGTQSVNAKVKALSRGREEHRTPSMQVSEANHGEVHATMSSRSIGAIDIGNMIG